MSKHQAQERAYALWLEHGRTGFPGIRRECRGGYTAEWSAE